MNDKSDEMLTGTSRVTAVSGFKCQTASCRDSFRVRQQRPFSNLGDGECREGFTRAWDRPSEL